MTNLMTASTQWRTRPADECYWGLSDMLEAAQKAKINSIEREYQSHRLVVLADEETDTVTLRTGIGHQPLGLTYHAFNQLSALSDTVTARDLRKLPAALAADCLAVGLARRARSNRTDQISVMAHSSEAGAWTTRALTGDQYSRFWTADLLRSIQDRIDRSNSRYVTPPAWLTFGGGDNPAWTGPRRIATAADCGDFTRVQPGDLIRPAGAYYSPASGRDTFILLINTERSIGLPGGGTGFRFVLLWNSETGAASIGGSSGIVDIVCGNHILWGARMVQEFRFRHVGEMNQKASRELSNAFGALEAAPWETGVLETSSAQILGANRIEAYAKAAALTRLPVSTIEAATDQASGRDYGSPLSAYAIASALTERSQTLSHAQDRIDLDRAAGQLYAHGSASRT